MTDWLALTARNARSVQTTIGWIYGDPGAVARYEALGLRLTTLPWELLGEAESVRFHVELEPPCVDLLARVDDTAGPNHQPGSRIRD